MGWFDILKLGGEDFGTPPEKDAESYDDENDRKKDFFHNLKDVATTRPHFEWSADEKYPDNIEGNLREIAQKLQNESMVGSANSPPYLAFTAPNSDYLVSFRRIKPTEKYTASRPTRFLDDFGNKRPTQPMDLENTKSVILFDSVYYGYDAGRLREVFGSPVERLKSIWGDSDEDRLRGMMRAKEQANQQELIDKRKELTAKKRELEAERKKLQKNLDKMPTFSVMPPWLSEQKKRTEDRILEIDNEVDKIDAQVREIDNLTQRSKGRTRGPRRRRRR